MGFKLGMDFGEYRSMTDYVSVSELKAFKESPYHYRDRYILKIDNEKKRPSMSLGTLCHCLLLEPHKFEAEYFVSDVRKDARTKAYQEVLEQAGSKTVISDVELERAKTCVEESKKYLGLHLEHKDSAVEASMFYDGGQFFPMKVKGRVDLFSGRDGFIHDYKTTEDTVDNESVTRSCEKWGYHLQVAFYMDLFEAIHGYRAKGFKWTFQQTSYPFACYQYICDEETEALGRLEYQAIMQNLLESRRVDHFPRIVDQNPIIRFPSWRLAKLYAAKEAKLSKGVTNGI